ncbi:hypothetical protein N7517_000559 [Penicillium concentricum]|uniref:Uncharacterized protein n=1 Tax=Penicillium concentricum TaxID=293559 RepID=A0A9W9SUA5_9EURO|nr:uncharacterized protein N7517_000559 [Penicillium concentricum]KAJ5382648.1 hypothetical protein N7517_000559 [Penicillium concentricum]
MTRQPGAILLHQGRAMEPQLERTESNIKSGSFASAEGPKAIKRASSAHTIKGFESSTQLGPNHPYHHSDSYVNQRYSLRYL